MAKNKPTTPTVSPFIEVSSPGIRRSGGFIGEEWNPKIGNGARAARVYREMRDTDPTLGAISNAIHLLIRSVEWRTERSSDEPEAIEAEEFLKSCMEDMSHGWSSIIDDALSCIEFGWALAETTYKVRRGPDEADPAFRSKHTDGRIGWRKIAFRAQESLDRWDLEDDGGIRGMHQLARDTNHAAYIPIEKALLFRVFAPLNNPEGRSMYRNAHRPWSFVKRLEEFEGIGVERDLAGMPVFRVPWEWLSINATPEQKATVETLKRLSMQIRVNDHGGLVVPSSKTTDPKSGTTAETGFDFQLMTSGGPKQIQPDVPIARNQRLMAMVFLAEFLFLGSGSTGSFALADSKTNLFATGLGAVLDSIAETFNAHAVSRLMKLNGFEVEHWPKIVHGDLESIELDKFATAISQLVTAGALLPDGKTERKVREVLGLPQSEEEDAPLLPTETTPAPAAGTPPAESVQDTALNGAQVTALKDIVKDVAAKVIPRDAGIAMIKRAFMVGDAEAAELMGSAGTDFVPAAPEGAAA